MSTNSTNEKERVEGWGEVKNPRTMSTTAKSKNDTKNSGTVSFWTNGPSFTNLLRQFIEEGSFIKVKTILEDGNMPADMVKQFFLYRLKFKGDTRKDGLFVVDDKGKYDVAGIYATAIATAISRVKLNGYSLDAYQWKEALDERLSYYNKELACLNTIFTFEELSEMAGVKMLERFYKIKRDNKKMKESLNGVILRDGTLVTCGFQQHINLYPVLFQLGLASTADWLSCGTTIHITSGQTNGKCATCLELPPDMWGDEASVTQAQVDALMYHKNNIQEQYGGLDQKSTAELVRCYVDNTENHGGKYNNLAFLKKYYRYINLPQFSKQKMEGKVCIRTSPKYSMPGLLTSKFDVTDNSISEMKEEFKQAMKSMGKEADDDNELFYFYQQYLQGDNGVCHYWGKRYREGKFAYALSTTQGDVVKGKKGTEKLTEKIEDELRSIASMLAEDLNNPVQLEFVVSEGKLYIVQLRLLKNNPSNFGVTYKPSGEVLAKGKTFSTGSEYGEATNCITLADILIVDEDADSKALLGKKALIVQSEVEFSHILALSKQLAIPSIYGTGKVDISKLEGKKLDFCAKNEDGWVCEAQA